MKFSIKRFALTSVLVAACSMGSLAGAEDAPVDQETALKTCQAATWDQKEAKKEEKAKKRGPVRRAVRDTAKFLGNEVNQTAQGIGRDMILCFSVQDIDPYAGKAPTDKPYEVANFRLVDGSMCSLTKYPDTSCKVNGGFADGTIIAPVGDSTFVVGYPNGARVKLVKSGSTFKVYRPDKSVTTFEKTLSGSYKIHNSELGYMGEGLTDQTGLRYDFGSFGSGNL